MNCWTFCTRGAEGSFQGDEDGRNRLGDLVSTSEFSRIQGVERFVATMQDHLEHDKRDAENRPVRIKDQLRQGFSVAQVYDLVFGLGYLKPRFELRWQGKRLDQLSPGERGTLLLVFSPSNLKARYPAHYRPARGES